ncbi:hypothetical protein RclHR1_08370007 [Rhizophagus clarus]|uniref:L-type lectin-like domain-containing protein n=1 Tax=Rhizophagus clarus TaxID=94130 RepID=A0A2Z6SF07_9GLOM|nr:hypothetical protein RclHR1_08370007 [Rhizophagus clarus]
MAIRLINFVFFVSISLLILSVPTFVYSEIIEEDDRNLKLRHDYKLSFKKPYYYNHTVPFFDTYGHTLLAPDFIRLAPSVPNHSGSIWAQIPNSHKEWEIKLSFRITGNFYVGGRGIAFWYTKDRAEEGPVYGNKDKWDGLVIMFETVDHTRKHDNPYIMAHFNDGSKIYNNISDPIGAMLGGCHRLFRNTASPVYARISYYDSTIKLTVDENDGGNNYYTCFEAKNIYLPTGYYFGVSATAEGETPDDHDILSLETYEINPADKQNRPLRPHEAEKIKKVSAENYEIPEGVKKRIEDIEKVVSYPKEGSKNKEDSRNIDFIKGMQTKIYESLDRLHEIIRASGGANNNDKYYVDGPSITERQLSAISQKLDKVIASISSLESRVSRLSVGSSDHAIKDLKENIHRVMGRIEAMDSRIAGHFYQTHRNSREKESATSMWLYVFYIILFIVAAIETVLDYYTFSSNNMYSTLYSYLIK